MQIMHYWIILQLYWKNWTGETKKNTKNENFKTRWTPEQNKRNLLIAILSFDAELRYECTVKIQNFITKTDETSSNVQLNPCRAQPRPPIS